MKKLTILLSISVLLILTFFPSCKEDEPSLGANFTETTASINEGYKRKEITISFEKASSSDGTIKIKLTNNESTYHEDYTTIPAAVDNIISIPVAKESNEVSFQISANLDLVNETQEYLSFEITSLPPGFKAENTLQLNIVNNSLMQGLVGEYLFDGNANDTSPTANHGTIHGALAAEDHLSTGDYALSFDGINDYIITDNDDVINFGTNQNFSISLWVAVSTTQADESGTINDIIRKWEGDAQGYPFAIGYYNNTAESSLRNRITCVRYDGSSCANIPSLVSPSLVEDTYQHIVYTKNGESLSLYLNSELVAQVIDNTSCTTSNSSILTIGTRGNLVRFLQGNLDDVRFYSRSLSTSEIELLYQL